MWGKPGRSASCTSAEVERSIAQGPATDARASRLARPPIRDRQDGRSRPRHRRVDARGVRRQQPATGTATTTISCGRPRPSSTAAPRSATRSRTSPESTATTYFQDVILATGPHGEPTGYALLPFPPLPAVVLLPFVAIWGLATDAQLIAAVLGALDRRASPSGSSDACRSRRGSGSPPRSSSAWAPSSGTRPSSGRRGTWPTSWPSGSPSSRSGWRCVAIRSPRPDDARSRARRPGRPGAGSCSTRGQVARRVPVRARLHGPADGGLRRCRSSCSSAGAATGSGAASRPVVGMAVPIGALVAYTTWPRPGSC